MFVRSPKYRKRISDKQLGVLLLVGKFRFVSVPVLAEWLGKDKSSVYEQLIGLVEQGYVFRQYDSSYRLQGKPATYALTAKGIKYIRDNAPDVFTETTLRNLYKNRTASDTLVVQSLATAKLCLQLKKQYPDSFELFTKTELAKFEQFLRPLPDLYIRRSKKQASKPEEYLIEILEAGTFSWILRKRLQAHQENYEEHEDEWGEQYPTLLFVCGNASTEKRIHRLFNNGYATFDIMTTIEERLAIASETNRKIWIASVWDVDWDEVKLRSITT